MSAENDGQLRILIIDDAATDREWYRRLLTSSDSCRFSFAEAESGEEGLAMIRSEQPDCILLDYCLPDCDGLELVAEKEIYGRRIPVVMLTGLGNEHVAKDAMKAGVHDYLSKRLVTQETLLSAILGAISAASLARSIHADTVELRRRANQDTLTGLPNRGHFADAFKKVLANLAVGVTGLISVIDLDGFKPVNDQYGHMVGDAVLREVGVRLRSLATVGAVAGRLGGDEFAFMHPGPISPSMAVEFGECIVKLLAERIVVDETELTIGASVGLVSFGEGVASVEELMAQADQAMYRAKRAGKNRAVYMTEENLKGLAVESATPRVLLVDDEADFRRPLARKLRSRGFEVVEASSFGEAQERLECDRERFTLLLTDVDLGDGLGIDLARSVNGRGDCLPVLVMTGMRSMQYAIEALRLGVADFLAKPFEDSELDRALERVQIARMSIR